MSPAVLPVSPGPKSRCLPSSQAASGLEGPGSLWGLVGGTGRMTRTLETAGHSGNIFFFHPHDHLMTSHYHPHFMGEETEAQTREEMCRGPRGVELRFNSGLTPRFCHV